MLDNKLQPNAPQSLLTRQLNIAHSQQQLLLLPPSRRKSGRPPAGNNPSQVKPPNKPNDCWDSKPTWDARSQPYQGTRPGFNHRNRFQSNRDSLYDRVKARNRDLEGRFIKNKRDPPRLPSRVRTPYTPADDKQYKNHLAQVRSDLSTAMLHLGHEHGNSQSAHLVGKAISTLGNLHKLAVEGDQSEDSSQISPTAEEHSPPQSRVPQLNEEQIWKDSYNLFISLPDSAQTEDTLEHLVNKCYNDDAHDALLRHYSFESDFVNCSTIYCQLISPRSNR